METWASLSLAHLLPEAAGSSPFLQSTHGVGNGGPGGANTTSLQIFLLLGPRADEPVSNTDTRLLVETSAKGTEMEGTSA